MTRIKQHIHGFGKWIKKNRYSVSFAIILSIIGSVAIPTYWNYLTHKDLLEQNEENAKTRAICQNISDVCITTQEGYTKEEVSRLAKQLNKSAKNNYEKGLASFNLGEFVSAIYFFNQSLNEGFRSKDHYFYIGTSFVYLNDHRSARYWFNLCNESFDCLSQIGTSYASEGDYSLAIEYFNKSISKLPNPSSYYNLGTTYVKIGNNESYRKAIEYFDEALKFNEKAFGIFGIDSDRIKFNKAYCLMNLKEYEDAREIFEEIEKKGRSDVSIYVNLGETYLGLKKPDKALNYSKKALQIDPLGKYALTLKLKSLFDLEEFQQIIYFYEDNMGVFNDSHSLILVGGSYIKEGKVDKGIGILKSILFYPNPDLERTYVSLSAGYGIKGEYSKALEYVEKALELNPNNEGALVNKEIILKKID